MIDCSDLATARFFNEAAQILAKETLAGQEDDDPKTAELQMLFDVHAAMEYP